jgi:hypothetical protein
MTKPIVVALAVALAAGLDCYNEAIDTLVRWCHEVVNPELSAGEQAAFVACYGAGIEIASILTGVGIEEVTADVRSAYRKYYQKEENGNNGQ